jgi:2-keto-3-deoxy-L-rhamnonate aldolase RhmA
MEEYQKSRYLIIQIESPVGIANLPEMLEKHGDQIASVIVGPFDLSVMNGTPAVIDSPQNLAAIQQVFGICKQYGKSCGIFCPNYEKAKLFQEMGAQVLWFSAEIDFLTRGYNETLSEILTLV